MPDHYCPTAPFPLQITDLERSTVGWSSDVRYKYLRLLTVMWSNGGIIADDDTVIADAMGQNRARNWRETVEKVKYKLVSHETETGFLTQTRLLRDIEKEKKFHKLQSDRARKGWEKRHAAASNDDMPRQSPPSPSPSLLQKKGSTTPGKPAEQSASKLAWEGKVIRLNTRDFEQWKRNYCDGDETLLRALLQSRDDWLDGLSADDRQRKNFIATSNDIRNKARKALNGRKRIDDETITPSVDWDKALAAEGQLQ